jgi:thiamine-phosphate pyrophosphorylase
MNLPKSGLYAITQTQGKTEQHVIAAVDAALRGGAAVVQYRNKQVNSSDTLAYSLLDLCHRYAVPMIINDDIDLAKRIGADGVHLGKTDGAIEQARNILGSEAIIGVSCYNSIELAISAQAQLANYVAFGRFFNSDSKPLAAPAEIETLRVAKTRIRLPIVAIGGILPDNGQQLLEAGADLLAVIGGLFDHKPKQAARAYLTLFE